MVFKTPQFLIIPHILSLSMLLGYLLYIVPV